MRPLIRQLGFALCVAAAITAFAVLTPKITKSTPTLPSATGYMSLITQALADDASNNLLTAGAPQQAVVNGWTARDLLTIIAKENVDILAAQGAVVDATGTLQTTPFDDRIPALLLIGVIAVAWGGMTAPKGPALSATSVLPTAEPVSPAELPAVLPA